MTQTTKTNAADAMQSADKTLAQFIEAHGITMTATRVASRPDKLNNDWDKTARHFVCTLSRGGMDTGKGPLAAQMTICFSQGSARTKPPTVEDVLDCLASDACGIENSNGFEDWASEYGYDTDSRKAEKIHEACSFQRDELRAFIGDSEAFKTLLFNTERL